MNNNILDITSYSDRELSLHVYNNEFLYKRRFSLNKEELKEYFLFTNNQWEELLEDLEEEKEEEKEEEVSEVKNAFLEVIDTLESIESYHGTDIIEESLFQLANKIKDSHYNAFCKIFNIGENNEKK